MHPTTTSRLRRWRATSNTETGSAWSPKPQRDSQPICSPIRGEAPPPALHRPLSGAREPDHLFLHDLAVAPECRGRGIASVLLEGLLAPAQRSRLSEIRLVALADAQAFWLAHGWRALPQPLAAAYGEGACLMSRTLV